MTPVIPYNIIRIIKSKDWCGIMAKSYNQKMKILYIMKIFLEKTDENHVITMKEIISELNRYDIKAERKSIYDDIEALRLFGFDIICQKGKNHGYCLASREFELPELKLLVDAVQSFKFVTAKKSAALIKKLEGLMSRHEAGQLQRQVVAANRIKTMNESIYYNVDKIHTAILNNVKILFTYFEWTVSKEVKLKRNGEKYCISPWTLVWDNENYYMIGYDSDSGQVKHYRVDKMLSVELSDSRREGREYCEKFNAADFSRKTFGMFGGEEHTLTVRFENKLIGVVIDRFGKDVTTIILDDEHFAARLNVAVSNQFFGWLSALGKGVTILEPNSVREDYKSFLKDLLEQYEQ